MKAQQMELVSDHDQKMKSFFAWRDRRNVARKKVIDESITAAREKHGEQLIRDACRAAIRASFPFRDRIGSNIDANFGEDLVSWYRALSDAELEAIAAGKGA